MTIPYRDTDFAKQIFEAFKLLEKKYSKRLSVNSLNAKLIEDGLLPMLVVQDRNSGDIVTQVFNFIDYFPSKQSLTQDSMIPLIENLLSYRCGKAIEDEGSA